MSEHLELPNGYTGYVTIGSLTIDSSGSILNVSPIAEIVARLDALETKVPLTRQPIDTVTHEVEVRKEIRLVREVTIQVPGEPGLVLIDAGAVWAIVSFLTVLRLARWVRNVYQLGAVSVSAGVEEK